MTRDAWWAAVDRALDEGREPLDDAVVVEHFVEHPEDLGALEDLLARLAALPGDVAPTASHSARPAAEKARSRTLAAPSVSNELRVAAAALLIVGLGTVLWTVLDGGHEPSETRQHVPRHVDIDPSQGRVVDVLMTFTRSGPEGTQRTTWRPGETRQERITTTSTTPLCWSMTWTSP